ncbi:hypothetical protein AK830_g8098 [Neonectria ditissima]|uniref:FAD-binding PCMH-type domain-containing protein n=1 Tax=Neonectria ditissima TaxID=78410 RepID=A0A0P7BEX5_9HYPO|nr:hypothetical protein AK830_g8098 [Neonectria ditissima]
MLHSLLLTLALLLADGYCDATQVCKCVRVTFKYLDDTYLQFQVPGASCWPTSAEWNQLNRTISGQLIQAVPPASVCYQSEDNFSQEACKEVLDHWGTDEFHSDDPVSVSAIEWMEGGCDPIYPNGTVFLANSGEDGKVCSRRGYPAYVVNATAAADVQAAVRFAQDKNVRVTVKNTGHNGARTTAHGSLSIWTHNLKTVENHPGFSPICHNKNVNEKPFMAATIGASVQGGELWAALAKHNVTAVTGTNADVGSLGWAMGGGHGFLTGTYGIGADNIVEATIVTASGEVLTANSCQNEDLFWAIRGGGGGGTSGVVVNATVRAYPMPSVAFSGLNIYARNDTSPKAWWKLIADFHALVPSLQSSKIHGYYYITGPPSSDTVNLRGSLFLYNSDNQTLIEATAPVERLLKARNATASYSLSSAQLDRYTDLLELLPSVESSAGKSKSITASRLISKKVVLHDSGSLAETLEYVGPKLSAPLDGTPNPSISGSMTINRKAIDNTLNPAWRDTAVHLISTREWTGELSDSVVDALVKDMTYDKLNALRQLDSSSGAYINEASAFEPGWQWSFYGPNYARLRSIKDKYDPRGLLWCRQCVGSEDWVEQRDGILCKSFRPAF